MIFPEKIKNINPTDLVLEIGPGSQPHPRADVFLDREFSEEESEQQFGYASKPQYTKPFFYYQSLPFPFKDKEFDYVICSHVIEHVPQQELEQFIMELQRIAKKGYIEFPTIFYELVNYQPVHIWLMSLRGNKMLFLDKTVFQSNFIHKVYRELFYTPDKYFNKSFYIYRDLFFAGFEWFDSIAFDIVEHFDELINENDFLAFKSIIYNASFNNTLRTKNDSLFQRLLKKSLRKLSSTFQYSFKKKEPFLIDRTAILENKGLIFLGNKVEIKEYVIIRTFRNSVSIGSNSQINPFTVIYGGSGVIIGENVMIAPHCMIAAGNHDYIQTEKPMRFADSISKGPIIIEDDVWIGANCTITDGVTIGKGSVIAANSLVNKNVDPYSIVGGVPIKNLGNRKTNSL